MSERRNRDPYAIFAEWMEEAVAAEPVNPNAMALATVDASGRPSQRMVLLKGTDGRGFVFYSNTESQKGEELAANPNASLCFYWRKLGRQVRVEGAVEMVSDDEADAYFATRERSSQIGAWASKQSRPLKRRFDLERAVIKYTAKFGVGAVPRPAFWSGYRLTPARLEFWREKPFRLHERIVYLRDGDGWTTHQVYP